MPTKILPDGRFVMWGRLTAEEKHMLYKHGFNSPPIGVPSTALRPSRAAVVTKDTVSSKESGSGKGDISSSESGTNSR